MNPKKGGFHLVLVVGARSIIMKQCSPADDRLELCFKRSGWFGKYKSRAQSKNRFHILSAFYGVFALKAVQCIYFRARFNLKAGIIENIILNDVVLKTEFKKVLTILVSSGHSHLLYCKSNFWRLKFLLLYEILYDSFLKCTYVLN